MQAEAMNTAHIKRLNNIMTRRLKLYLSYSMLLIFFAGIGTLAYRLWPNILPRTVYVWLEELVYPAKNAKIFDFIASIINNSVDIFKISVIIIVAGFTYIAAPLCRAALMTYGIAAGWSVNCTLTSVCSGGAWSFAVVAVGALYSAVTLACCVRAELAAERLRELRHPRVMVTSRDFWGYIMWLFVAFGYVLMISTVYRLFFIFFV